MRVLVTGGTGFLGGALLRSLLDGGHQVRALVRRPDAVLPDGVERADGTVNDGDALARAADGCEGCIHAAALVSEWGHPPADFDRVNVEGLRTVVQACRNAGVERILHTSSFMALGPTEDRPDGVADEDTRHPADHFHNDYERTKAAAEAEARRLVDDGAPLVSVYPGVIYGPGPRTEGNILVHLLDDLVAGRMPALVGGARGRWSFAYVDDVAEGHRLALEKGVPGARFCLGGDNRPLRDALAIGAEQLGARLPGLSVPHGLAKAAAGVQELWARLTGGTPQATRSTVDVLRHDWCLDSSHARDALGWNPRTLEDGLEQTTAWMRAEGDDR